MTLEEAKEILKDRGCILKKDTERHYSQIDFFVGKEMKSAVATVNANGYKVCYNTPALEESAKQLNDSLLDEQAKKIKSQKKEIKHLNKLLASRNKEIWELKDRLKGMKNLSKEIDRLHVIMKGKDELLDKYRINDANKEEMIAALRKELAENVVNKVDENALKSAESALAYKDEVIEKLTKKYEQLKKNISDAVGILDEKDEETPSYPTEDDPDEVSLADMVKIVIEAFFDGKSVIIK